MPKEFGAWFKDQAVKPEQTLQVDVVVPCGEGTLPAAPYSAVEPDVKTTHVEIVIDCKGGPIKGETPLMAAMHARYGLKTKFSPWPAQKISDLPAKISGDPIDVPLPRILHSHNIPQALLNALSLPVYTKEFSVHFEAGKVATVAGYAWNLQTQALEFFQHELTISQLQGFTNAVQDHGIARRAP